MTDSSAVPAAGAGSHLYADDVDAERRGWYELVELVRSLTPDECLEPGYYRDPDWTVRDVVAHLGSRSAIANATAQTMMLATWRGLREPTDEAAWWIRKSGAEHFAEHLVRLRAWVAELVARRVVEPDDVAGSAAATESNR